MHRSIVFFDTETTGLPRARNISALQRSDIWPDMVSISWIIHTISPSPTQPSKHTYIIKPEGWQIPEDSIRIHGITNEYAHTHGTSLREVMTKFINIIQEAHHIIAHNMEFDKNVIHHACKWRLGIDPTRFWDTRKEFCSMVQSKGELKIPGKYPKPSDPYKNPGLDELYRATFIGKEPPSGAHSADRDVEVLYQIVANRWRIL
jgi:DNA polymerase III epsilon subunit-like protein